MADPATEPRYVLTLTSAQARVVVKALDLYGRVGMRQLDAIGTALTFELRRNDNGESIETVQAMRRGLDAVKQALGFSPGASLSIRGAPLPARLAYDVQQVLRQRVAHTEFPGGSGVWHDDPLPVTDHPLATCTVLEKLMSDIRPSAEIEADIQRSQEESTAEAAETEALQSQLRTRLAAEQRRRDYRQTMMKELTQSRRWEATPEAQRVRVRLTHAQGRTCWHPYRVVTNGRPPQAPMPRRGAEVTPDTLTFHSTWEHRGMFPADYPDEEVKNEPMLFNCDFPSAYRLGGPITRGFLRGLPDDWLDRPVVIDSRVHMLMPGWWPCIPGWHHDDVPRRESDGQPDYETPAYRAEHLMGLVNGHLAPTQFALGPFSLSVPGPGKVVYEEWDRHIRKSLLPLRALNRIHDAPSGTYIQFDWQTFHTGTQAVAAGWRWFIRVTRNTHRKPTNEVRRQVQVYLSDPFKGW